MNFGLEMLPEILNLRLTSRFLHFKTTFPNLECYSATFTTFSLSSVLNNSGFSFPAGDLVFVLSLITFPKNLVHVISRKVLD